MTENCSKIRVKTTDGQVFHLEKHTDGWYVCYVMRQMALMFKERVIKIIKCQQGEKFQFVCVDHHGFQDTVTSESKVKVIERN